MKRLKNISKNTLINTLIGLLCLMAACDVSYIDEIQRVEPGPDTEPPEISIESPLEGTQIRVTEDVTAINIRFEVTDDIEIGSIVIRLNGTEIASFDDFPDYRRAIKEYRYENLENGEHTLTITATDLSGKSTSESVEFVKVEPYRPEYDGEIFYISFDGDYMELVNIQEPEVEGSPGFADGISGRAYAGAEGAYLTYPGENLHNNEFSAAFWYRVNAVPDRAGILVMGPPDEANPNNPNNRQHGFRLFRENAGGMQRIKLNVGTGSGEAWFDGGAAADIDPAAGEWSHIAFTVSGTECAVYINGDVVSQGGFDGIDWSGCDILSVASGAPRFTEWGHLWDASLFDELRLFHKVLTQQEIQDMMQEQMQ